MNNQLKEYVSKMRELGYTDVKIRSELASAGWSDSFITSALTDTIPAVPSPSSAASPVKIAGSHNSLMLGFLYTLNFISLWIGSGAFILILSNLIDKAFPQTEIYRYSSSSVDYGLNASVAALIITAPIFIFLFIYLKSQILKHPEFRQYISRKFLIIVTLVAAFLSVVIDLITVLASFLNGDVSLGFILIVLVIIFVALPIFVYYLHELSTDRKTSAV